MLHLTISLIPGPEGDDSVFKLSEHLSIYCWSPLRSRHTQPGRGNTRVESDHLSVVSGDECGLLTLNNDAVNSEAHGRRERGRAR